MISAVIGLGAATIVAGSVHYWARKHYWWKTADIAEALTLPLLGLTALAALDVLLVAVF